MPKERQGSGWNNITILSKGRLEVTVGKRTVVIEEKAAPRKKEERKFPVGTIDSLMPTLRVPYRDFGVNMEEGYWAQLDSQAKFSPFTACAKLRSAGIDHLTVAKALLARDESLQVAIAFGRMSKEQVNSLESLVAGEILKYYK